MCPFCYRKRSCCLLKVLYSVPFFHADIFPLQGSYTLTMKLYGENGKEELTCISFGFSIGFFSSADAVASI